MYERLQKSIKYLRGSWAVVVVQLVEGLLPTPEVCTSNPNMGKIIYRFQLKNEKKKKFYRTRPGRLFRGCWMTTEWPDFGIKSCPIFSKSWPKICHCSFADIVMLFKTAHRVAKYLGNFDEKICCPNLSKIYKSGHTEWRRWRRRRRTLIFVEKYFFVMTVVTSVRLRARIFYSSYIDIAHTSLSLGLAKFVQHKTQIIVR